MKTIELHRVAEVRLGRQRSPKNHSGSEMRPYLRAANVGWSGLVLDDVKEMNFTEREMTTFRLRSGDLLLNEASGSPNEVGKPALWQGEIADCAFQNTLLRVRPGTSVDARYLLHFFAHQAASGAFAGGSRGVGILHLGRDALAHWKVPLPALEEQRLAASILDKASANVDARRAILSKLNELESSIFKDMFEQATLESTVQEVSTFIRTGPFGSQLLHGEFVDEGIAVLGLDNVVGNEFEWRGRRYITAHKYEKLRRFTVWPGDVLVSIMGTTGRCVVVPEGIPTAINTKHLCAITLDSSVVLPEFLRAAFLFHAESRAHLLRQTKGSIMDGLNMGIVKSMPIPVPPMERQQRFVERVESVRRQRISTSAALNVDSELLASIQERAFRDGLR